MVVGIACKTCKSAKENYGSFDAGFTGVAIGVIVAFVIEFIWVVVR